jgi:hypothetical protein
MLSVLPPNKKTRKYITDRAPDGDPFFLMDLKEECAAGCTVSIDARNRSPNSWYWRIKINAHPCVFGDFCKLWDQVQETQTVPARGMMDLGPLLRACLKMGEVPEDAELAGYVYFLDCNKSKKQKSR